MLLLIVYAQQSVPATLAWHARMPPETIQNKIVNNGYELNLYPTEFNSFTVNKESLSGVNLYQCGTINV